jgi:hypothetical protein
VGRFQQAFRLAMRSPGLLFAISTQAFERAFSLQKFLAKIPCTPWTSMVETHAIFAISWKISM